MRTAWTKMFLRLASQSPSKNKWPVEAVSTLTTHLALCQFFMLRTKNQANKPGGYSCNLATARVAAAGARVLKKWSIVMKFGARSDDSPRTSLQINKLSSRLAIPDVADCTAAATIRNAKYARGMDQDVFQNCLYTKISKKRKAIRSYLGFWVRKCAKPMLIALQAKKSESSYHPATALFVAAKASWLQKGIRLPCISLRTAQSTDKSVSRSLTLT